MTREQLEHAIRAACDVIDETDLFVFGSQSILGQHGDAPDALRVSMEVDVDPCGKADQVDVIDGALGEGSAFHELYGFYVHGVSIESAVLPHGWEGRTIAVCNANTRWKTGHCLEVHDLAASKLAAFRDKDRDFVRVLLSEELVDSSILGARLDTLELEPGEIARRRRWVDRTVSDLRGR